MINFAAKDIFCKFDIPEKIIIDNETQFKVENSKNSM